MKVPGYTPERSRTGIRGVGIADVAIHGKRMLHYVAHCGQRSFKFNIVRLGREAALQRALRARADYEASTGERSGS